MVATRSGGPPPADARVACPVCGGQIHPIAGRCKHCKSDLVALRAGSPGIPTALIGPHVTPALGASTAPAVAYAAPASGPVALNGAAFAPVPAAVPIGMGRAPSMPSAAVVTPARGPSQWGRRWPIVVVVLAAAAIVVSIVLLVLPDKTANAARRRTGAPPPTPDNMDTNAGQNTGPDPWGMAPQPTPPPADPDTVWGDPQGGTPGGGGGGSTGATIPAPPADEFIATLGTTFCRRLLQCSPSTGADDVCDRLGSQLGSTVVPGLLTCTNYDRAKASSCLTTLSRFPCMTSTGQLDMQQMKDLVGGLPDCAAACQE